MMSARLFVFASLVGLMGLTGCSNSTNSARHYDSPPPMTIDQAKTYTATMVTAKGTVVMELYGKDAPVTVNNFVFLARAGYYDGLKFHRVEPGFVIQGGDPEGTGSGGPGYTIVDERNARKHVDGTLAMAKTSAPNSAGSQFYITLGAQPSLDAGYTVFGQVTSGIEVTRQIVKNDVITKITIEEK